MHLTLDKFLRITQAASKQFHRESDRYRTNVLLYNHHVPRGVALVQRICPYPSRLRPLIKHIEEQLDVQTAEDGRLAFKSYTTV
eukprot:4014076-Pleurochrysis_carterae.AAC.1